MQPIRRRSRLIALSCLGLIYIVASGSVAARKQPTDEASLEQQLNSLNSKISHTERKLRITRSQKKKVNQQLAAIEAKLDANEARLHGIKRNVSSARVQLRDAISDLRSATDEVNIRRDQVADRLVALCQEGEIEPLEVALNATSFSDFANRMYLVNEIVSSDVEKLDSLSDAQERADARRQQVADTERRYTSLQQQEEGVRKATLSQRALSQEQKERLLIQQRQLERALDEFEADSRSITVMLQRMQRRTKAGGAVVTPWRGSFIRPVGGRISSGFGYRTHPILGKRRMHTGLDLASPSGTPIKAAAGGVVIYSSRYGGYGNCVMVDHGDNVVTLYGHCSSLAVSVGQKVNQGQTIAYVGSTGMSTGPHLHFEVRKNGTPINPLGKL